MDYGSISFKEKKYQVKKNQQSHEIKFRPSTDVGDYNIKLKKIKSFILGGDKTQITVDLE